MIRPLMKAAVLMRPQSVGVGSRKRRRDSTLTCCHCATSLRAWRLSQPEKKTQDGDIQLLWPFACCAGFSASQQHPFSFKLCCLEDRRGSSAGRIARKMRRGALETSTNPWRPSCVVCRMKHQGYGHLQVPEAHKANGWSSAAPRRFCKHALSCSGSPGLRGAAWQGRCHSPKCDFKDLCVCVCVCA